MREQAATQIRRYGAVSDEHIFMLEQNFVCFHDGLYLYFKSENDGTPVIGAVWESKSRPDESVCFTIRKEVGKMSIMMNNTTMPKQLIVHLEKKFK